MHNKAFVDSIVFKGGQCIRTGLLPENDMRLSVSFKTSTFGNAAEIHHKICPYLYIFKILLNYFSLAAVAEHDLGHQRAAAHTKFFVCTF